MPSLLAEEPPALIPLLLSAIGILGGVCAALFLLLIKSKDANLVLAKDFAKDASADQLARHAILTEVSGRVNRVAEGLEAALEKQDTVVEDVMDALRAIRSDSTELLRQRK